MMYRGEVMNSKIAPTKEPQTLFLLALLAFLEIFFSGVVTLLIHPDPKNAIIFGYSVLRLFLVAWIWILATIVLVTGIIARKNKLSLDTVWLVNKKKNLRQSIYAISFALIVWGLLSLFSPAYQFGRLSYIFERVQPFSIALGAVLAQSWFVYLFFRSRPGFCALGKSTFHKYYRPTLIFAVVMTGLGIFIASTKFGLVSNLVSYNVPGIPLSSLQLFFILILAGLWIAFVPDQEQEHSFLKFVNKYRLIPFLIFLTAVLVWGLTAMNRHYFVLQPAAPSYQPFPFSDARKHDLGGISILHGYGSFYSGVPHKTLYFVFMAILHFFAGYDYWIMIWLQILILAFIPVILFLLGEKFHSTAFGIFLSLVLIIRQRNSIVLSTKISTVNPKLFMTEEMTLLGVTLFTYLLFLWIRDRKIWLALLCGGCIGATSLFRLTPLFLFPAGACLVMPAFWKMGKKIIFSHLSAYTLAFLIILVPWIIAGINPKGGHFLLDRLFHAYNKRYGSIDNSIQVPRQSGLPEMGITALKWEENAVLVRHSGIIQEWTAND